MSPEQQVENGTCALEIADHIKAAMDHLVAAHGALHEAVHAPDGGWVGEALTALGVGENTYGQLLLLAGDVRAQGDALTVRQEG